MKNKPPFENWLKRGAIVVAYDDSAKGVNLLALLKLWYSKYSISEESSSFDAAYEEAGKHFTVITMTPGDRSQVKRVIAMLGSVYPHIQAWVRGEEFASRRSQLLKWEAIGNARF